NELVVKMLHEDWAPFGAWTIFPLFTSLYNDYSESKSWIFFSEEDTVIDIHKLVKVHENLIQKRCSLFLGHAVQDHHPAIIHHFAFADNLSQFSFPDFVAGWAISSNLLKQIVSRIEEEPLPSDFTIDVQHEMAMYIRNEGKGVDLTNVPELCTTRLGEQKLCVTSFNNGPEDCVRIIVFDAKDMIIIYAITNYRGNLSMDDIFFAVKTTKKFHQTRVPYVQKTLGQHARHLVYYSETEDPSIPTENIGVPNTDMGHCAKLQAIIERSEKDKRFADTAWVVVIDDDTIMRMVLSRAGVKALLTSGCKCWQPNSPDDMWLGNCFKNLDVAITHSPAFHQARPIEYVPSMLAHQTPVSFHKHYENDPMAVYKDYLS
ncbi:hypothetical protein QZH41_013237, partial [Actinostola sp. cb2023]